MWIPILITLLVLALAAGPILWFRPTPYQRRIASLRTRAAQLGMSVQLMPLSQLGLSGEQRGDTVAAYGVGWVREPGDNQQVSRHPVNRPWRLVKGRLSHELHFAGRWDWQKGREAQRPWHGPLRELLAELPEDVIGLENAEHGLWLYWQERGGPERVEEMAAILQRLREIGHSLASGASGS